MEKQTEKRRLERRDFPFPVLVEVSEEEIGSFESVQSRGRGIDISSQGIGVVMDKYMDPGQIVKLFVPVGTPETLISSFSEVRWVEKSNGRYRVGLSFIL